VVEHAINGDDSSQTDVIEIWSSNRNEYTKTLVVPKS
jgi:hypothetical protein